MSTFLNKKQIQLYYLGHVEIAVSLFPEVCLCYVLRLEWQRTHQTKVKMLQEYKNAFVLELKAMNQTTQPRGENQNITESKHYLKI